MLNIPLMKLVELPSRLVGAAPVIRGMADAIGFVDVLNTLLPWDSLQCRTSPGERILAMVLDILTGKSPLYRAQDSLAETDVPLLLDRDRTAAGFTDDDTGPRKPMRGKPLIYVRVIGTALPVTARSLPIRREGPSASFFEAGGDHVRF